MTTPSDAGSVVTPGNHDGVHLGHRALVAVAREQATSLGARTIGLFFDPHPAAVLTPGAAPAALTTSGRRVSLLLAAGCDEVVAQPFDTAFASQSPEAFVQSLLVGQLGAKAVVVGPDFRFGRGAVGNLELLEELGQKLGFAVHAVPPIELDGERVSSTRTRALISAGDVKSAAALLARYHDVDGLVIEGDQRGRTIGFPTANLSCDDVLLPPNGVYAVVGRRLDTGQHFQGVANLGVRPTIDGGSTPGVRSVEVHIFDFDGDIYDERVRVAFVSRIRSEQKFDGLDALTQQITVDCANALESTKAAQAEWLQWL